MSMKSHNCAAGNFNQLGAELIKGGIVFTDSERQAQGEQTQKTQTHTFPYDSNILDACSRMS